MDRKIVGFDLDEVGHWVARLECGHGQHVRHDPPWTSRPWVITPEGRAGVIGRTLRCRACDATQPATPQPGASPDPTPRSGSA